jgi:rare lipoprotein A (peptidoglycan hydrolase)
MQTTKKTIAVCVSDRGPTTAGRAGDGAGAAANKFGMVKAGVIDAQLEVVTAPTRQKRQSQTKLPVFEPYTLN